MDKEKRSILAGISRLEARSDSEKPLIQGYAALFNTRTVIWGMFEEEIAPGAFTRALKEKQDIRSLFNHDANVVLGRTTNGSMKLTEDETGLWTETTPPDTQQARDVVENIRVGNVSGMSFMFQIRKQEWIFSDDAKVLDRRVITDVDLYEAGPVVFPAYEETSVGLRSLAEQSYQSAKAEREAALKAKEIREDEPLIQVGYHPDTLLKKIVALTRRYPGYSS